MEEELDEFAPAIGRLMRDIETLESELNDKKRMVNQLCRYAGVPERFSGLESAARAGAFAFKRDQFYGKPLATGVREYLEMRGPSDRSGLGAATVNEIYDALVQGGYRFETRDVANAKRGLRIALTKSSTTFHRVGDSYGLLEWYPSAKPTRESSAGSRRSIEPRVDESPGETLDESDALKLISDQRSTKN